MTSRLSGLQGDTWEATGSAARAFGGMARSESQTLAELRRRSYLSPAQRRAISEDAAELIAAVRAPESHLSPFEQLLSHFSLATEEGLALMGLAEALLRVPDDATGLNLVKERLASGNWHGAAAASRRFWPKLAARVLEVGQGAVNLGDNVKPLRAVSALLVLALARRAMRTLGKQFIMGESLGAALRRSQQDTAGAVAPGGALCSFDLLGEGARTFEDATRYRDALLVAIDALAADSQHLADTEAPSGMPKSLRRASLSLKLSALEPRYEEAQRTNVMRRLVPTLSAIFEAAARAGLGVTIDAEEQDRLDLSLQVLTAALSSPHLAHWDGAGLAVQAYGTRALEVIEWVAARARARGAPLHVRLVKGAYWDTEIKRAQERGLTAYPVFTRKAATDVAYLAAAHRLFEHAGALWPQFATHNPHTLCAVRELASNRPYELQRLHGMGERLYRAAASRFPDVAPVRVYAPVGNHRALLPYLVRRLLENGANTSFLSSQDDPRIPPAALAADPLSLLDDDGAGALPMLPLPTALFHPERVTARGWDLGQPSVWRELQAWHAMAQAEPRRKTGPCVSGHWQVGDAFSVRSPSAVTQMIGEYRSTTSAAAREALSAAHTGQRSWGLASAETRARCLERAADLLEKAAPQLLPLLVREAGKCWPEAIGELREAVDFCRYYAARGRELGVTCRLPGPTGESNVLTWHGRGVFYCIAPWNFPLAIFMGQIAAALVVGNAVLAKPAPQTPLIGAAVIEILLKAGVPAAVLHFLPGDGIAVSEAVMGDSRLGGVAFTGSTVTAQRLNRVLAARAGPIIPFIAETGGLNAMIVDSTALLEQAVDDVLNSAFRGAGQRCSALRLLCVQADVAEPLLKMLAGAMNTLIVGDPADPQTDVGPLIDKVALDRVNRYLGALPAGARLCHRVSLSEQSSLGLGHFCAPTLIELDAVGDLTQEIFGPVLHVVRYPCDQLHSLIAAIEASGYGLTLGIHTRLNARAREICAASRVGNTYVNRAMVGAVVGVQPFGGEGLSGTGPKAGGPHYLERFAVERVFTVNESAWGGNVALLRGGGTREVR